MDASSPTGIPAIAERIVAVRTALNLNQTALAKAARIATNTLNQWEKAKGRPSLDEAFKFCAATNVTLDYIYRGNKAGIPFDLASKLP